MYTNVTLTLIIKKSDEVISIKNKIEELEEIAASRQRLIFMGNELFNQDRISHYCIREESIIICESSELLVILPNDEIITVPTTTYDTIASIKEKIEDIQGIPKAEQFMFHSCCSFRGRQLDDSKTIFENNLGNNLVYVLQSLKQMQLFIEILQSTRKIINISVDVSDTILEIKKKIQNHFSHDLMGYKLFYYDNELDDSKSLAFYGIRDQTVMQFCESKIVFIKRLSHEKLKLKVKKSDTIDEIKTKIAEELNTEHHLLKLYFCGSNLDNSKTIEECKIGYGMTVELQAGIKVYISSSHRNRMVFEVQSGDTVLGLKEKIKVKAGIPIDYQYILHEKIELSNDYSFIIPQQQYFEKNINLTLIVCTGASLILKIMVIDNTSYIVKAKPSDNILTLKEKVEEKFGISIKNYFCYFEAKYLSDDMKLSECGLRNMACVEFCKSKKSVCTIFTRTPTGKIIIIMALMSDSIKRLKSKITDKEGIPEDQQILFYGDRLLEDGCHLSDYTIKDNVTLDLKPRGC